MTKVARPVRTSVVNGGGLRRQVVFLLGVIAPARARPSQHPSFRVWIGYDQKKPLGQGMCGAEAALPIWVNIFKAHIGDRKDPPKFEAPGNIVFVPIDKLSGSASAEGALGAFSEAFIAGTQPGSIRQ